MLSQLAGFGIRAGTVPRRIVRVFRDWPCRYMAGGPPVMGPAKTECMWAREGAGTARARDLPLPLQEKASERGCRPTPARCTVPPSAPARGRPAGTGTCCAGSAAFWCRDGGRLQPAACRKKRRSLGGRGRPARPRHHDRRVRVRACCRDRVLVRPARVPERMRAFPAPAPPPTFSAGAAGCGPRTQTRRRPRQGEGHRPECGPGRGHGAIFCGGRHPEISRTAGNTFNMIHNK